MFTTKAFGTYMLRYILYSPEEAIVNLSQRHYRKIVSPILEALEGSSVYRKTIHSLRITISSLILLRIDFILLLQNVSVGSLIFVT